jgi:ribosomal silencing factor RsfS
MSKLAEDKKAEDIVVLDPRSRAAKRRFKTA